MKVKLTVHRDVLVIETVEPENENYPGWVPVGPGKIGCVLCDTKRGLGASKEALNWLQRVQRSHDDIGDVDWFACDNGTKAFGWIGGLCSLKDRDAMGSRTFQVFPEDCTVIPNDVPEEAKKVIARTLSHQ
jgi:hypothetical protein